MGGCSAPGLSRGLEALKTSPEPTHIEPLTTEQVLTEAGRVGFDRAGVTLPILHTKYTAAFRQWLAADSAGEMHWMRKWSNFDQVIRRRWAWAQSVIVVCRNYYQKQEPFAGPRLARYAMGQDYHLIMPELMDRLIENLKRIYPKLRTQIYSDTGPVLQKAFAEQAGIGWIGKNTLLIVPDIGSFVFIGLIFCDCELQPTSPLTEDCGDCTFCLRNCPNAALVQPGVLDAHRCIAYLTIEKQSAFTAAERKNLHNWLYGCDLCQECCPKNQQWAKTTGEQRFLVHAESLRRTWVEWCQLDARRFAELFRCSAVQRLGYRRFRRNLAALR